MKRKVHTESEMVKAVQELESGVDAETVARNHGISKATLYNWKSKYSGMEVSQVRRLKELEEENRKLKQMYAELAFTFVLVSSFVLLFQRAGFRKCVDGLRLYGKMSLTNLVYILPLILAIR